MAEDTEEGRGWCFSTSRKVLKESVAFLRASVADGGGARMHHLIQSGITSKTFGHDLIGLGLSWGGPSDRSRRDQYGLEIFYAMQLTNNITVTPDIQITIYPSFNDEKDVVGVYSVLRIRYAM